MDRVGIQLLGWSEAVLRLPYSAFRNLCWMFHGTNHYSSSRLAHITNARSYYSLESLMLSHFLAARELEFRLLHKYPRYNILFWGWKQFAYKCWKFSCMKLYENNMFLVCWLKYDVQGLVLGGASIYFSKGWQKNYRNKYNLNWNLLSSGI